MKKQDLGKTSTGIQANVEALFWAGELVLWIVLMIKAYQGEMFKVPVIGDMAEKKI